MGTAKRERQKANRAQRLLALERAQRKRRRNQTWLRGVVFLLAGAAVAVLISWLAFGRLNRVLGLDTACVLPSHYSTRETAGT